MSLGIDQTLTCTDASGFEGHAMTTTSRLSFKNCLNILFSAFLLHSLNHGRHTKTFLTTIFTFRAALLPRQNSQQLPLLQGVYSQLAVELKI